MQQNKLAKLNYRTQALSSCISLGLGDWKRQETKDVSTTSERTYKNVTKARESKMPAGSSVRSLPASCLKETRNEIDQVFRAWLNLTSHCPPPPLELWFQASALESGMAKLNKKKKRNSPIEQRLYLAASHWIRVKKQQSIRLEEKGARKSKWQQERGEEEEEEKTLWSIKSQHMKHSN